MVREYQQFLSIREELRNRSSASPSGKITRDWNSLASGAGYFSDEHRGGDVYGFRNRSSRNMDGERKRRVYGGPCVQRRKIWHVGRKPTVYRS